MVYQRNLIFNARPRLSLPTNRVIAVCKTGPISLLSRFCLNGSMPYITLSDQVKKLQNPQRSDIFVQKLRMAVREGLVDAAETPGRFEMPKVFVRRGSKETYTRMAKDLIIDGTPAFEAWFADINRELSKSRGRRKIQVSVEAIETGLVDFKALVDETRRKLGTRAARSQQLDKSQAGSKARTSQKGAGRPKKAKATK